MMKNDKMAIVASGRFAKSINMQILPKGFRKLLGGLNESPK